VRELWVISALENPKAIPSTSALIFGGIWFNFKIGRLKNLRRRDEFSSVLYE
jgi:hypothetical protein